MVNKKEWILLQLKYNSFFFYFYNVSPNNSNITPANTPITYNNPTIIIFFFIPLFALNNTASPTPDPTNNPEIIVAAEITFSKYICVKITDEAQLGIKPINPAIIGAKIGLFSINPAITSSPIK